MYERVRGLKFNLLACRVDFEDAECRLKSAEESLESALAVLEGLGSDTTDEIIHTTARMSLDPDTESTIDKGKGRVLTEFGDL